MAPPAIICLYFALESSNPTHTDQHYDALAFTEISWWTTLEWNSRVHKELFSLGFIELLVASSDYILQRMSKQLYSITASAAWISFWARLENGSSGRQRDHDGSEGKGGGKGISIAIQFTTKFNLPFVPNCWWQGIQLGKVPTPSECEQCIIWCWDDLKHTLEPMNRHTSGLRILNIICQGFYAELKIIKMKDDRKIVSQFPWGQDISQHTVTRATRLQS